jgi:sugar phosphate isomerase/epimerase
MKIGAMVESFRLGLQGGLQAAAELGANGVQIYATSGDMHPGRMKGARRTALRRELEDRHLELAALCGDFGGHGLQNEAENRQRIDEIRRVMDLAVDLGCRVVTTHIGVVPAQATHPRYPIMAKACERLAQHAGGIGVSLAIETGPEPARVLRAFLDDIGADKGLGVNFDPANLVMVCRENIPEAVRILGPAIVHTHAKDGVNLKPVDPELLYGSFAGDAPPDFKWTDYIQELPLGEGDVHFDAYVAALRQAGFDGYLTIEREAGENPAKNIGDAVIFLKKLLGQKG